MERVLIYSPVVDSGVLAASLADYELVVPRSRLELTEAIVAKAPLLCLILSQESLDEGMREFLFSLKKSFPILEVCVITPGDEGALPEGYRHLDGTADPESLRKAVAGFVASVSRVDRREHPRYDWPLRASVSADRQGWQPYPLRALSASGAFLESTGVCPDPGTRMYVRVQFQEHALTAGCEVLPARAASSNLPPGFGIRFVELGMLARGVIDRIVRDALIRSLLEPEEEPALPTLGGEDLLDAGFELL